MIENISVDVTEDNNISIVTVKGEIDIYTCGKLRSALANIIEKKSFNFILDLTDNLHRFNRIRHNSPFTNS